MSAGFQRYSPRMILWLSKFKSKGWLSDVPQSDRGVLAAAIRFNLVSNSIPYKLTKRGSNVVRGFRSDYNSPLT